MQNQASDVSGVRDQVVRVIGLLRDELRGRTDSRLDEAVAAACNTVGITPQDYERTVEASPELAELERETVREALAGSTDPGPHDEISRESPSGQPGDLRKNRTHPDP